MNQRTLVAYATKAGSTAEVAETIGETLRESGLEVDVYPVQTVKNISDYQAVVLGSAIRAGRWLPEAMRFLEANQEALRGIPVAFFTVCLTLMEDTPENREKVAAYLDPARKRLTPQAEGYFAGVMNYARLPLPLRFMIRLMRAPEGDFRDWDGIREWALNIAPILAGEADAVASR